MAIFELFKHSDYVFDENLNILLREVSFQTSNFIEKRRTYQKLNAAKASGMSEVANSVLHNVGNVLNSLNISSNILIDFFGQSKLNGLLKLKSLLKDNHHELSQLLSHNKLSQGLKEYILKLADLWEFEKVEYYNEAISLNRHVEHIKAIINSQQSISGSSSMSEPVLIEQLMEDAIAIHFFTFQKYNINVIQKYNASFPVLIDKIKVSQILINFIKNAFVALLERSTDEKKIILDIEHIDQKIRIYVSDNGIGIEPDTMDKIFTSGFTTKSKGYGFGLHSCLIAAKELGGSIEVLSEGKNKGATFILEFPFKKIPINPIL